MGQFTRCALKLLGHVRLHYSSEIGNINHNYPHLHYIVHLSDIGSSASNTNTTFLCIEINSKTPSIYY
jgi:hypothetical protein